MGHSVLSDFADRPVGDPLLGLYKNCGFWTHDEAAILFNIAKQIGGEWLDIGAHTGWTAAHELEAGCKVTAVDNMFAVKEFYQRFSENVPLRPALGRFSGTSKEFFQYQEAQNVEVSRFIPSFDGVVIDGDHCSPVPFEDARSAKVWLSETGVILFHDFIGRPVREGVEYLLQSGFKCKVYFTPHMVACCWRGDYLPPHHIADPRIDWERVKKSMPDFDFARCA